MSTDIINYDNAVFRAYAYWVAVLIIKTLVMAPLTARQRQRTKTYANAEDAQKQGGTVKFDQDDVERVRRAHLNDLENILPFAIIGFLYIFTEPSEFVANWLFKITAISRIFHTIFYLWSVPVPSRGVAFGIPLAIALYMAIRVVSYFC